MQWTANEYHIELLRYKRIAVGVNPHSPKQSPPATFQYRKHPYKI